MRWLFLILGVAILARVGYYVAFERVPAVPTEISAQIRELKKGATVADRCIAAQWLGKNGGAYAVEPLSKTLEDPNAALRQNSAWALGQLGPKAISAAPLLVAALDKDHDPGVRMLAAEALLAMGPDATREVLAALHNPNDKVRRAMIDALRASPDAAKALLPALIAMLDEPGLETRKSAAEALATLGPAAAEAIPALTRALERPNGANAEFFNALVEIGPASISTVTAALASSDAATRRMALYSLSNFGTQAAGAWPRIVELLADPDATVRDAALVAAPRIAENPADLAPRLVTAMDDTDASVRRSAARAISEIGPAGAPCVPKLLEALQAAKPDDQWELVEAIGRIGPSAIAAAPTLVKFVSAKDSPLFSTAVEALGRIGPDAKDSLAPMIAALEASLAPTDESEPGFVDVILVDAIGKVGANNADQVAPVMLRALAKTEDWNRAATLEALANLNPPPDDVIAALVENLRDERMEVAEAATVALGRCGKGSKLALPALLAALDDAKFAGRLPPIIEALANYGEEASAAVPTLITGMQLPIGWNEDSGVAAAQALPIIAPASAEARDALARELQNGIGRESIRVAAAGALAEYAKTSPEAIATLEQAARIFLGPVGKAAKQALEKAVPRETAPAP